MDIHGVHPNVATGVQNGFSLDWNTQSSGCGSGFFQRGHKPLEEGRFEPVILLVFNRKISWHQFMAIKQWGDDFPDHFFLDTLLKKRKRLGSCYLTPRNRWLNVSNSMVPLVHQVWPIGVRLPMAPSCVSLALTHPEGKNNHAMLYSWCIGGFILRCSWTNMDNEKLITFYFGYPGSFMKDWFIFLREMSRLRHLFSCFLYGQKNLGFL